MKIAAWAGCALFVLVAGCAPSKDIESPADPPGIENQDESGKSAGGSEETVSIEAEAEAGASSETGD